MAAEIVVKPQPLHAAFLSERIEGMSPETSAAIYSVLARDGMLGADGMILVDPRYRILDQFRLVCFEVAHSFTLALSYFMWRTQIDSCPAFEYLQVYSYTMASSPTRIKYNHFSDPAGGRRLAGV